MNSGQARNDYMTAVHDGGLSDREHDRRLHEANKAAHNVARAALGYLYPLTEEGDVASHDSLEAAVDAYEQAIRAVATPDREAGDA